MTLAEDNERVERLRGENDRQNGLVVGDDERCRRLALAHAVQMALEGTPAADVIAAADTYLAFLTGRTIPADGQHRDRDDDAPANADSTGRAA